MSFPATQSVPLASKTSRLLHRAQATVGAQVSLFPEGGSTLPVSSPSRIVPSSKGV